MSWCEECVICGVETQHDRQSLLCTSCVYNQCNAFWDKQTLDRKVELLLENSDCTTLEELIVTRLRKENDRSDKSEHCNHCKKETPHWDFFGDCVECSNREDLELFNSKTLEDRVERLWDIQLKCYYARYVDVGVATILQTEYGLKPSSKYLEMFCGTDVYKNKLLNKNEENE